MTPDPYYDADCYYDELENMYNNRPCCTECGEHIREDYAYRIGDKLICEGCLSGYKEAMDIYD